MEFSLVYIGSILAIVLVLLWLKRTSDSKRYRPPGPPAIPILGHLHLLMKRGVAAHTLFQSLARKYGPVMSLQFASVPVVVASSPLAAKEFLKTHDAVFASRPESAAGRHFVYNYSDLGLSPYGEQWRHLRKLVTQELFTARKVEMFREERMGEVRRLCKSLFSSSLQVVDLRAKLGALSLNQMTTMLMSKRYIGDDVEDQDGVEINEVIAEIAQVAGEATIGDSFPWLRFIDPVEARMKRLAKRLDAFLEARIAEHINSKGERQQMDFLDMMLNLREAGDEHLQGNNIKGLMVNMLTAGTDPSAVQMEWALAEMIKHPEMLAKAQKEIESIVGKERLVLESDVPKLEYLHAFVKESFRLHPIAPLLLPHQSMEPRTVMGYHIPRGAMLFVNVYAIGRDPSLWENPTECRPERFLDSSIDVKGLHFELLPFGSGRRICAGLNLGLMTVHLTLANLVHGFDWQQAPGLEIDTTSEKFGMALNLANKLQAIPIPRLSNEVYVEN